MNRVVTISKQTVFMEMSRKQYCQERMSLSLCIK